MRIAVVGLGAVGEACAHALVSTDVARRLVLINRTVDLADAVARDLRQARAWGRRLETEVHAPSDGGVLLGCELVVLTLGARLRGDEARRDVAGRTFAMLRAAGVLDRLRELADDERASVLVVSNPVESTVTWLLEETGIPAHRLFGLGTTVESARLSGHLASRLDVDAASAWVHVLGEHGPGIVVPGGGRLEGFCSPASYSEDLKASEELALADAKLVRAVSEEIGAARAERLCAQLEREVPATPTESLAWLRAELGHRLAPPATRFAIAAAVVEVARAIGSDADRVMSLASLPPPRLGLPEVAVSLPFAVRRGGLGRCVLHEAPPELQQVCNSLREAYLEARAAPGD